MIFYGRMYKNAYHSDKQINWGKNMEIMAIVIVVFAVIIGLVIGYVSISVKMKSSQEAAELMLLNAEQEATNLRGS